MERSHIYINGLGIVSPQGANFQELPVSYTENQLRCIDPGYREFIPAEMIRRMGRIIKMGVAASKLCLRDALTGQGTPDAGALIPDAIITGTGLGCMEDTEKFLASMINNNEEFLTPTSFIQSTHNTVAGQIALLIGCHNYNFTYVHRGISFESALMDAMTQIKMGEFSSVLTGGTDELTPNLFAITSRLGFWKQKPVDSLSMLSDTQRGSIAGEGATFFFVQNRPNDHTYARLDGVDTFLKPASEDEPVRRMHEFLAGCGVTARDISLLVLGLNGDPRSDTIYRTFAETAFPETPQAYFKHLCGEYPTASAFATWAASRVIKSGLLPDFMRLNSRSLPDNFAHVLIYNHYRENNHAFILLSRP